VRPLEDVRLSDGGLDEIKSQLGDLIEVGGNRTLISILIIGEEGDLHQREEAEANGGDPIAMLWLARRFYWGYGNVQPDIDMARHWFERAAEANNAEGLYNMGVFYNDGIGRLTSVVLTKTPY